MNNTSTPYAEPDTPIEVFGESPDRIEIPMWVVAQIKLNPPRTRDGKPRRTIDGLYDVALLLLGCRFGVHPDEVIRLDRKAIGRWAGVRADKATWITEYLAHVGFLEIYRGRHTRDGREPDRFRVNARPPADYDGPQTLAELDLALSHPADPAMAVSAGHSQNPADGAKGQKPVPRRRGKGSVSAGHSQNPADGVLSRARRSESDLLSEERRGDQTEPVPGGAAEPPATGKDEHDVAAAEIVEAAPWDRVATRLGSAVSASQLDVDQMTGRIAERLRDGSVTVVQARQVIAAALEEARHKPVAYVAGAFGAGQLSSWRARVSRVVLAQPSTSGEQISADVVDSGHDSLASADAAESLPECEECGTPQGGSVKGRFRRDENGRMVRDAEGHHVPCACVGGPAVWHAA